MHGRMSPIFVMLLLTPLAGCQEQRPSAPPVEPTPLGAEFDSQQTGTITGIVCWVADVPHPPDWRCMQGNTLSTHPHPHLPKVDLKDGGLADSVVFLRKVDPRRSKSWSHGPVRVEYDARTMRVVQDRCAGALGFVRQGEAIEVVNRDCAYHSLRGRGADVFSLPLPDTEHVSRHTCAQAGIVELGDAPGYAWNHAHLFVAEHPYYARTDAHGRFLLDQVPAGEYELVCWQPSWVVTQRELDPESIVVARIVLAPPKEQGRTVTVEAGKSAQVNFVWSRAAIE